jgi:hypothetical protein
LEGWKDEKEDGGEEARFGELGSNGRSNGHLFLPLFLWRFLARKRTKDSNLSWVRLSKSCGWLKVEKAREMEELEKREQGREGGMEERE